MLTIDEIKRVASEIKTLVTSSQDDIAMLAVLVRDLAEHVERVEDDIRNERQHHDP